MNLKEIETYRRCNCCTKRIAMVMAISLFALEIANSMIVPFQAFVICCVTIAVWYYEFRLSPWMTRSNMSWERLETVSNNDESLNKRDSIETFHLFSDYYKLRDGKCWRSFFAFVNSSVWLHLVCCEGVRRG